jgi:hypothetical protein
MPNEPNLTYTLILPLGQDLPNSLSSDTALPCTSSIRSVLRGLAISQAQAKYEVHDKLPISNSKHLLQEGMDFDGYILIFQVKSDLIYA